MEDKVYFGILIDIYGNFLTENQRNVIENFYNYDLSLGEIAENLGVSRQAVNDTKHKAENILKEFEKNLRLAELKDSLIRLGNEAEVPLPIAERIKTLADSIGG